MEISKEIQELITAKQGILSSADLILLEDLAGTQTSIYNKVSAAISKMPQSGGKFVFGKRTEIAAITKTVTDAIRNSTYRTRVDEYLRNFDQIEDMAKQIVGSMNDLSVSKINLTDEKKAAISDITDRLLKPEVINANISQPITNILYKHARYSLSVDDATKALREAILQTETSPGMLTRYVGQVARDALYQYNGVAYQVMQRELGLERYQYIGGLLKDSRPQCMRWINHNDGILTREYLEPELAEATQNILTGRKSDRFRGYSKYLLPLAFETFSIVRGGHNCIHEALPIK